MEAAVIFFAGVVLGAVGMFGVILMWASAEARWSDEEFHRTSR